MKTQTFKTQNGDTHHIDECKNHFINGKCVNPFSDSDLEIGDTFSIIQSEDEEGFQEYSYGSENGNHVPHGADIGIEIGNELILFNNIYFRS